LEHCNKKAVAVAVQARPIQAAHKITQVVLVQMIEQVYCIIEANALILLSYRLFTYLRHSLITACACAIDQWLLGSSAKPVKSIEAR
jgi:hypothetical protein